MTSSAKSWRGLLFSPLACAGLWLWAASSPAIGEVLISEFMASNEATLADEDGAFSDWIELHNSGPEPADLDGWFLTDRQEDRNRWRLPSVTIPPGGFLVVFASGKDRADPSAPLHTDFSLAAGGEYLALVRPDGEVASEFSPRFPPQFRDVSYGHGRLLSELLLVGRGEPLRAHVPPDGLAGWGWLKPGFNDAHWIAGTGGVGYDQNPEPVDYNPLIGLNVESLMYGIGGSVYIRYSFQLESPVSFESLILRIHYDDGFAAYLNGRDIAQDLAPDPLGYDSLATGLRPDELAVVPRDFDVSFNLPALRQGENILAVHGLNQHAASSDLLVLAELIATGPVGPEQLLYFPKPTPGASNAPGVRGLAGRARFSPDGGTFIEPLQLVIEAESTIDETEIRYTLDGSVPSPASILYTGPVSIAATTVVRARLFGPGLHPGPPESAVFIQMDPAAAAFTSDLPVMILHNFGAEAVPHGGESFRQPVAVAVFEPGPDGRTALNRPEFTARAGFNRRGSSTANYPKSSYRFEFEDESGGGRNLPLLGMPADDDWILYAPNQFDLPLIHNAFMFQLSNDIGRYAPRTRLVELFVRAGPDAGTVTGPDSADYHGIYVLMESIKRKRLGLDRLEPEHNEPPEVTGGYLLKADRAGPEDPGFRAAELSILYDYPSGLEMAAPERAAQASYISNYVAAFGDALRDPDPGNPETGYPAFIDVDSWIDHHILNVLAMNVDALRLSTYFHKPRGGKLYMGPIWDFDRSLGASKDDPRPFNPRAWTASNPEIGGDYGTDFFNANATFSNPWYRRLLLDPDFWQRWIDRYQELRGAQFSTNHLFALVDELSGQLMEAHPRNVTRWLGHAESDTSPRLGEVSTGDYSHTFPGTYPGEIAFMKKWLEDRLDFIDANFLARPRMDPPGGTVPPGTSVELTDLSGKAETVLYYTLDETDPRAPGGGLSPSAIAYTGPISITGAVHITARALNPDHQNLTGPGNPQVSSVWSGPLPARFQLHTPAAAGNLIVTEMLYHPAAPPPGSPHGKEDFEFIELRNISSEPVTLEGVAFTRGIAFEFSEGNLTALPPNGYVLVVKNLAAFISRFGNLHGIAGEYSGNLDNSGERIRLEDAQGGVILDFVYRDTWHPSTDGPGFSLVIRDESAPGQAWNDPEQWRPSGVIGGSPGGPDILPGQAPLVTNVKIGPGDRAALIQWQTSEPALSSLAYGPAPVFDLPTALSGMPRTRHSAHLTGLAPITKHHVRISALADGREFHSPAYTFTTTDEQAVEPGQVPLWWSGFFFGDAVSPDIDHDGDGFTTGEEYLLGTDPTDPESRLEFTANRLNNALEFRVSPLLNGRIYDLLFSPDFPGHTWTLLPDSPESADAAQGVFTGSEITETHGYFRLRVRIAE